MRSLFRLLKKLSMSVWGRLLTFALPTITGRKVALRTPRILVRRFFSKKTDFRDVSHKEIERVENLLNNRPRKCLDFLTPYEVANNWSVAPPR